MKIKVIMMAIALAASLGVGSGTWAGIDILDKIESNAKHNKSQDAHISILANEQIKSNYKFDKKIIEDNIANYKKELRGLRKDCGGVTLSKCDTQTHEDYYEVQKALQKNEDALDTLKEKMEKLKEEKLQKLKGGE